MTDPIYRAPAPLIEEQADTITGGQDWDAGWRPPKEDPMTYCALLIPPTGLMECFVTTDPSITTEKIREILDSREGEQPYVRVELHKDEEYKGAVVFGVNVALYNQRAVNACAYLTGAYVTIAGPAVLTDLTERQGMKIIEELSR